MAVKTSFPNAANSPIAEKPPRLGRPKQAAAELGVSLPTWRRYTKVAGFPKLIHVTARCTLVDLDAQYAWALERSAARKAA